MFVVLSVYANMSQQSIIIMMDWGNNTRDTPPKFARESQKGIISQMQIEYIILMLIFKKQQHQSQIKIKWIDIVFVI